MAKKTIAAVPGQPTVVSDSGPAGKKIEIT